MHRQNVHTSQGSTVVCKQQHPIQVYVVSATWLEHRAKVHAPRDNAKCMLGVAAALSYVDVNAGELWEPELRPLTLQGPELSAVL